MKLLPRRTHFHHHHHHHQKQQEKLLFFKKHYRWLLWLFLSLYLFLSSSFSPSSYLLHHHIPSSSSSTATAAAAARPPLSLKIYIYDLPSRYNKDWLSNPRCSSHLFASEVAIHTALLSSPDYITTDPSLADFFLVPVYLSCNFSTPNGFPSLTHARPLLSSAVSLIASSLPFWNRSSGRDHIFVASHDHGPCFHTIEDTAAAHGTPSFLLNSIILQTFALLSSPNHPCQSAKHVVIPPYVPPQSLSSVPPAPRRDIYAFFRGKIEMNPKNVSGRFYGRKVRTEIWRKYQSDKRFYLRRHRDEVHYRAEIARSVFCLCPRGWAPWSPRLVEAVALGCVPVIVADGIRLPFPEAVPWEEISVRVAEGEVGRLAAAMEAVEGRVEGMRRRMAEPAVKAALMYNAEGVREGDATWHVLRELEGMLGERSWRRREMGGGQSGLDTWW